MTFFDKSGMVGSMFVDTHAHLTHPDLADGAEAVVARARAAGIERIVNICTDEKSLELGLALAKKEPMVALAAACTPHDVAEFGDSFFETVAAQKKSLCAIGETGLDYYYEYAPKEMQKEYLLRYIELAKEAKLPLIFHCREAFEDLFALCDAHLGNVPAVLHCFTGTVEEAKGVIERGWFLSLSGIVTFKKAGALREVAALVPDDKLLLETDAPYLAPSPYRGKRNEPAYLVETAKVVAEVRGTSVEDLGHLTSKNASLCFSFRKIY